MGAALRDREAAATEATVAVQMPALGTSSAEAAAVLHSIRTPEDFGSVKVIRAVRRLAPEDTTQASQEAQLAAQRWAMAARVPAAQLDQAQEAVSAGRAAPQAARAGEFRAAVARVAHQAAGPTPQQVFELGVRHARVLGRAG